MKKVIKGTSVKKAMGPVTPRKVLPVKKGK